MEIDGNVLKGKIHFYDDYESPVYVMCSSTLFQIKVVKTQSNKTDVHHILLRFTKYSTNDDLSYSIKFSSNSMGIIDKYFTTDDSTWHLVSIQTYIRNIDIKAEIDVVNSPSTFAALHEDIELTDFELRGEDGSVQMHKAVLAAYSPVLRRMLGGTWKETREGCVDVPGTSRATLQHLKDFMYLGTLPDTGFQQLLLFASYYMIPNLEQKCVYKLISKLQAQDVCDLIEFAVKFKLSCLMLAILKWAKLSSVELNDLKQHFWPENLNTD